MVPVGPFKRMNKSNGYQLDMRILFVLLILQVQFYEFSWSNGLIFWVALLPTLDSFEVLAGSVCCANFSMNGILGLPSHDLGS